MVIPRGKVVYENLNSSFTNFTELLLNLDATEFIGYLRVNFAEYDGIIYFDKGKIINAVSENGENRKLGQEAVNEITTKAKEKDGTFNVSELSSDIVMLLANLGKGQAVYEDLNSDFSSLDKLITKLKAEQHTGYIEINTEENNVAAIVFLQAGEPVESIMSVTGQRNAETGKLQKIFDTVSKTKAFFNVYKASLTATNGDDPIISTTYEIEQLLDVWAALIHAVEKQPDSVEFNNVFKQTLIEKAEDYPFLDPFAAEFKYADGKIAFEGNVVQNFSRGLSDVLQSTISKMDIGSRVTMGFDSIKNRFSDVIDKFSISKELDRLI